MKITPAYQLLTLLFLLSSETIYAQWSEQDSTRLQKMLSGEEEILLNPEFMKSIESGTLLSPEPELELLKAPPVLFIHQDFSEYISIDSIPDDVNPLSLPPEVYKKYQLAKERKDLMNKISAGAFSIPGSPVPQEEFRIGNSPVTVAARAEDLFLPEVRDGQKRGSINGKIKLTFSMEDVLNSIFSKSERAKRKNRKQAKAWRSYNNQPLP